VAAKKNTRAIRTRPRSAWLYGLGLLIAYGLYWPITKLLTLFGQWPRAMTRLMTKALGKFPTYAPTAADVFVCSYYKSGTNWALQICQQIAWRGQAQFTHIHDVVPWPDVPQRFRYGTSLDDPASASSPTGLRVIKTHLPSGKVPYSATARYLCVVRDPKDVFVSSYHFTRQTIAGPLMPSVELWLDCFLSADAMFGPWAEHAAGYWEWRVRRNVLFLTYEDMKRDLEKTVQQIAEFMGVNLSPQELAAVIHKSSFRYMKSIEHCFEANVASQPLWVRSGGAMIRRGEAGKSDDLLSESQRARVDSYCRADLQRLGSEFAYDRAFTYRG
jgi:Sulfotransferase domain